MPLIDDLRRLAVILPPNFRVSSGEVGDVLSGLVAYNEHGQGLLDAAAQGPQAVADFYHSHISDTRPEGADEPQQGAPVENVQPTGTAAPGPSAEVSKLTAQVEQLAALVGQLVSNKQQDTPPEDDGGEAAA